MQSRDGASSRPTLSGAISRRGTRQNSTIHLPHTYALPFLPLLDSTGCKGPWANQGDLPYQQRFADSVQSFTQRS